MQGNRACGPSTSSISQISHRYVPTMTSAEYLWQSSPRMAGGFELSSSAQGLKLSVSVTRYSWLSQWECSKRSPSVSLIG